jgi:hypothetical protein
MKKIFNAIPEVFKTTGKTELSSILAIGKWMPAKK